MNNFNSVKIKDIGEVVTGKTPRTANELNYSSNDYMFVSPSDLHTGYFVNESTKYVSELGLKEVRNNSIDGVSVLVGCIGWDMGNVALTKTLCVTNQQINSITSFKRGFDPLYVYYWLSKKKDYLFQIASVTRTPILSKSTFENIEIPLPNINTQQKIAGVLSVLDDKIEINRKINAELEQMARTLYDYWFVQFDFPDENGKPYKTSGGPMKFSPELNRQIPTDWEVKTLSELLSKRTESAEPNASLKCIDLSVIPSSNISIADYNEGDAFNSNMKRMYEYDILFGSIRPYLKKAGLAPFNGLRAGTVHAFYAKKASNIEHSLITMTGENFFNYAISRSGGSTRMPSVSADSLLEYAVPYDAKVVGEYHKMFSSLTDTISHNIVESQNLATLRDWLLPMLMNGQVSVGAVR